MPENEPDTPPNTMPPTPEIAICTRCKCESTLPELFRNTFGKKYCPVCAHKIELRNAKILFGLLTIPALLDLLYDGPTYGWFSLQAWSIPLIVLIVALSLTLHELSHALSAMLMQGQVFGIQIGAGRQLLSRWFGGFYLSLHLLPIGGICFAGFPTAKRLRLRYIIYAVSGLVFHILTILVAIPLVMRFGNRFPFLDWIILVNGFMFLLNVIPYMATTSIGPTRNDGLLLWYLLTGKVPQQELQRNYYRIAAAFAFQQQKIGQTSEYIAKGLVLDPTDEVLENLRVFLLLKQENKLAEAYGAWQQMVEAESFASVPNVQKAIFYNNYAWVTLMHKPEQADLETAQLYAEKAFQMAPWVSAFKGTLAAIHVARGMYEKGVELALATIEMIKEETPSPIGNENLAANLATAALGYHWLGERETAVNYLQEAINLSPRELTVQKAQAHIQV